MDQLAQFLLGLVVLIGTIFFVLAQYRLFQISNDLAELKRIAEQLALSMEQLAAATRSQRPTSSDLAKQKLLRGQTGMRERTCPGCAAILEVPTTGAHNCPACGCAL